MSGIDTSKKWTVLSQHPETEALFVQYLGISPLVARVLAARGITNLEEAYVFLTPNLARDAHDPEAIPGIVDVADRVERAIRDGERIAIFGDFDVDGMSSTALMTLALRRLGADVHPFIPRRFGEGYGISEEAVERVVDEAHPDLIVTVDTGIAAANEVEFVLDLGIDVCVTDHHEPADLVPRSVPVADPKLDPDCPSADLAGVGVAYKLIQVLAPRFGMPDLANEYLDLAALGTVSDMMTLTPENRAIVAAGIERMHSHPRPGLVALAACARTTVEQLEAENLPFSIVPRLNAAGRMGDTKVAFELLMTEDPAEAQRLAAELETINNERRAIEQELSDTVMELAAGLPEGTRSIVLAGPGWHEGVKGIVASRLVNRYHVPCLLFSISEDGVAHGSGRTSGTVDLFRAVEGCQDLCVRFGGHPGAVGVTLEEGNIDAFRDRLESIMQELPAEQFISKGEVAAYVTLQDLTLASVVSLDELKPFGQGNKKPLFAIRNVRLANRSRVGSGLEHLRFNVTDGRTAVPAIMFRTPDIEHAAAYEGPVDIVCEAAAEEWQGRVKIKLMVKDILYRDEEDAPAREQARTAPDPAREDLARMDEKTLTAALVSRMIGDHPLLKTQAAALERLSLGKNTLAVMATGRGKSLIFHVHAARMALLQNRASVFVYPLRALVGDQAFHLEQEFSALGLKIATLTGETPQAARDIIYRRLATGDLDVVLTTPEYLALHADALAASRRIGFVVVDESHHAAEGANGRSAYKDFPYVLRRLGNPVTLAVTATASSEAAVEITRLLGIDPHDVLVDNTARPNLSVVDLRDTADKDAELANIVRDGKKTVVYVNSRDKAVMLVRMLRHEIPEYAHEIAFYHAGLTRDERRSVENAFRSGRVRCIVSTSAFGEGVNLPDIEQVVLYHVPFGPVEFNQMSGRAGRDGKPAQVYLAFGRDDLALNERILSAFAPARDALVVLYKTLKSLDRAAREQGSQCICATDGQIAEAAKEFDADGTFDERVVGPGISIFEELGFLSVAGIKDMRRITMNAAPARMDLMQSARFREGLAARDEFEAFGNWLLNSSARELLERINKPIIPTFGSIVDRGGIS
jgi:single-stranded-DNA-specific exonuclease